MRFRPSVPEGVTGSVAGHQRHLVLRLAISEAERGVRGLSFWARIRRTWSWTCAGGSTSSLNDNGNGGNSNVTISGVTVTGTAFRQRKRRRVRHNLAPNQSATLMVRSLPQYAQRLTGSGLTVASNAPKPAGYITLARWVCGTQADRRSFSWGSTRYGQSGEDRRPVGFLPSSVQCTRGRGENRWTPGHRAGPRSGLTIRDVTASALTVPYGASLRQTASPCYREYYLTVTAPRSYGGGSNPPPGVRETGAAHPFN